MHLTENMIVARSKVSDLSSIKRINLWGCELTDISIVKKMTNIEVLALSVNNLSCLKPLENCRKLQELYLRKNNIHDFNQLSYLKNLPLLSHLWLAENPCCVTAGPNYRAYVVKMLPHLKKLDEEMITPEDIELSERLDIHQLDSGRSAHSVPAMEAEMPQKSPESHYSSQPNIVQQSSQSPQSNQQFETNKPVQDTSFMHSNETPDLITLNAGVPELNLRLQSNSSYSNAGSMSQQFDELQSPKKSPYLSQHSNSFDQKAEKPDTGFTLPLSFTPRSENEQQSPKDVQFLNRAHSLNQVPQLNLVVQIHQPQSGLEIPLQIPRSVSLQTINECSDPNDEQQDHHYQEYEAGGDQTTRSNYHGMPEEGSTTFRSRAPEAPRCEPAAEIISHANTASHRPHSQGYQNPNMLGYEMATQTPRSRNSMSVGGNNNLRWEHGIHPDRNSARSTSTLTTTTRSARRHNANVLAALLCIVPELDMESLQVLDHTIQCRMDELSLE